MKGRFFFSAAAAMWLGSALAGEAEHDHDHDDRHVSQAEGLKIVHAWTRATDRDHAEVFMEIHNEGDAADVLVGGHAGIAARVELRGAVLRAGERVSEPLEAMPVAAASRFDLEPQAVFLLLDGLTRPLREGEEFEMEVAFEHAGQVPIHVQVEAANATQHSHAGHQH